MFLEFMLLMWDTNVCSPGLPPNQGLQGKQGNSRKTREFREKSENSGKIKEFHFQSGKIRGKRKTF